MSLTLDEVKNLVDEFSKIMDKATGGAIEGTNDLYVAEVDWDTLQALELKAGVYIIYPREDHGFPGACRAVKIGETLNLRRRLSQHIDHRDPKGLASVLMAWPALAEAVLPAGNDTPAKEIPSTIKGTMKVIVVETEYPIAKIAGASTGLDNYNENVLRHLEQFLIQRLGSMVEGAGTRLSADERERLFLESAEPS